MIQMMGAEMWRLSNETGAIDDEMARRAARRALPRMAQLVFDPVLANLSSPRRRLPRRNGRRRRAEPHPRPAATPRRRRQLRQPVPGPVARRRDHPRRRAMARSTSRCPICAIICVAARRRRAFASRVPRRSPGCSRSGARRPRSRRRQSSAAWTSIEVTGHGVELGEMGRVAIIGDVGGFSRQLSGCLARVGVRERQLAGGPPRGCRSMICSRLRRRRRGRTGRAASLAAGGRSSSALGARRRRRARDRPGRGGSQIRTRWPSSGPGTAMGLSGMPPACRSAMGTWAVVTHAGVTAEWWSWRLPGVDTGLGVVEAINRSPGDTVHARCARTRRRRVGRRGRYGRVLGSRGRAGLVAVCRSRRSTASPAVTRGADGSGGRTRRLRQARPGGSPASPGPV